MKILAIIPAKLDSMRIPRKNLRPMLGKPLLQWTIEAAKRSPRIDRVVVTTPDEELAEMARSWGAEVPFLEPKEISARGGNTEAALVSVVEWLKSNEGYEPDAVMLLQSTNPLRTPRILDEIIEHFEKSGADSVVTVSPALGNHNPAWMLVKDDARGAKLYTGGDIRTLWGVRSQDLPPCYIRNDVAYLLKVSNLRQTPPNLYGDRVELYPMDDLFDTDVNTPEDWEVTEGKLRRLIEPAA